jgi:F-type H+-transporting ATPase subunit delta
MSVRLSRRQISDFLADSVIDGMSTHDVMDQLASYLVQNSRTKESDLIIRDIEAKLAERGHVKATVYSARKLTAGALSGIEKIIRNHYQSAKNITIVEEIDESLIGGFRLELPDAQIDRTIKNKLEALTAI